MLAFGSVKAALGNEVEAVALLKGCLFLLTVLLCERLRSFECIVLL